MSLAINGQILLLSGTSSAGKSSIITALKDLDPSWVEMGPDLCGFFHMGDLIKEAFPNEYAILAQALSHTEIAHAIADVYFHEGEGRTSNLSFLQWENGPYSQEEMLKLIYEVARSPAFALLDQSMYAKETAVLTHHKMIDFIRSHSEQGFPVFVDGMEPKMIDDFIQEVGFPVRTGLAYLPLHHLADRVTKRNETAKITGNTAETRSYQQITFQFLEHYKCAEGTEPVIGHMSLAKLELAFSKMHPRDEGERQELANLKTKMIEEYRLDTTDKTALSSRHPYDLLVKTKKPAQESAELILKG